LKSVWGFSRGSCEAEIHDEHATVGGHHDIVGLEITMNDAHAMGSLESAAGFEEGPKYGGDSRSSTFALVFDILAESCAPDEFESDEDAPVRFSDIVNGNHVGVAQLGQLLRLVAKQLWPMLPEFA
jgi:hypothetical protein